MRLNSTVLQMCSNSKRHHSILASELLLLLSNLSNLSDKEKEQRILLPSFS